MEVNINRISWLENMDMKNKWNHDRLCETAASVDNATNYHSIASKFDVTRIENDRF